MFEELSHAHIPGLAVPSSGVGFRPHRLALYRSAKRAFDIVATLSAAPVAVAMIGALALLIKLDGGPAFYAQPRLGKNGKPFKLWKLRTMVPNASRMLEAYLQQNPEARQEWNRTQKLRNDPRITWIGRYLRKYSVDELPQLWNVFLGQMSLVGPRPMLPEQWSQYPGNTYFEMRPGLTGLWQVSERNSCSFAERAMHDTRYSKLISFSTDLQIMVQTVVVVVRGTGL